MPSAVVVDASIALKWVLEEPDSGLARRLLDRPLHAPDLLLIECANTLGHKVRRQTLDPEGAAALYAHLASAPVAFGASGGLVQAALSIALELEHPAYDCLYLAMAETMSLQVVTADGRFARAVGRVPRLAPRVVALADLA